MRVHLIDGTYELFRQHFSKRPAHEAPDGRDLKATVGVVSSLLALTTDPVERATHLAVAFDNPIRSFRNDLYAGYKTDEGMPPELRAQFDPVEEAVRAAGIRVWSMDRFEADDALAAGAARFRDAPGVEQVRILTPDKDLGQSIRGRRVIQVARAQGGAEIDEDALRARRGVGPASIPDLLALTGDAADGYPGLPGFGEKTAAALLARFERLDAIPDDPGAWTGVKVRGADRLPATLRERRPEALLYKRLATLVEDAPLPETGGLEDLEWRGAPRERWEAWCTAVGASDGLRARPAIFL